jgi:membrane protease YdiL (CAAX protease family)
MKIKNAINYLKEKHTFTLCILITVAYLTVLKGIGWIVSFSMKSKGYGLELIVECVGIIVAITIMHLVGKKHILKEKGTGILKGLFIGGFLVFICLITVASGLAQILHNENASDLLPLAQIVIFVATMAGVGISEEFIFRGTILNLFIDKFGKTQRGIYASIMSSSVIFGIAHITNVFSGVSLKSAFIQAVGAGVLGALLAAIYVRTRNIWVVAMLHAFMDFSALIGSGFFGTNSIASEINSYGYIKLIGCLIYLIPVLFLLRKKKLLEILKNEK